MVTKRKGSICKLCKTGKIALEKLSYTVEEWKDLDDKGKEYLSNNYEVILSNYEKKTKGEKVIHILKKFNSKNLDKGISNFNKAVDTFKIVTDSLTGDLGKDTRKYSALMEKKKNPDYSDLK